MRPVVVAEVLGVAADVGAGVPHHEVVGAGAGKRELARGVAEDGAGRSGNHGVGFVAEAQRALHRLQLAVGFVEEAGALDTRELRCCRVAGPVGVQRDLDGPRGGRPVGDGQFEARAGVVKLAAEDEVEVVVAHAHRVAVVLPLEAGCPAVHLLAEGLCEPRGNNWDASVGRIVLGMKKQWLRHGSQC